MPAENVLTHHHGMFGCFLEPGIDPTAPQIAAFAPPPVTTTGTAAALTRPAHSPLVPMPGFLGYVAVAVAYFALGVAVGALARRLHRFQTPVLFLLVVPGVLAGLGFLAWVVLSLA